MDNGNMDDILGGDVLEEVVSIGASSGGGSVEGKAIGSSGNESSLLKDALETIDRMESLLTKSTERLAELEGEIGVYQQSQAALIKQPVIRRDEVLKAKDAFIANSRVKQEGRYVYKITPIFDAGDGPQRTTVDFSVNSDLPPEAPAGEPQPFGLRQMLMAEIGVRNKVQYSPETHEAVLLPSSRRSGVLN